MFVYTAAAKQFRECFTGIKSQVIDRREIQVELIGNAESPFCLQAGMVITRMDGDRDENAAEIGQIITLKSL